MRERYLRNWREFGAFVAGLCAASGVERAQDGEWFAAVTYGVFATAQMVLLYRGRSRDDA